MANMDFSKLSLEEILKEYQALDAYIDNDDVWDEKYAAFEEALKAVDGKKMDKIYSNYTRQKPDLKNHKSVYDMELMFESVPAFHEGQKKTEVINKINKFKENLKTVAPKEYAKSRWGEREEASKRSKEAEAESDIINNTSLTPESEQEVEDIVLDNEGSSEVIEEEEASAHKDDIEKNDLTGEIRLTPSNQEAWNTFIGGIDISKLSAKDANNYVHRFEEWLEIQKKIEALETRIAQETDETKKMALETEKSILENKQSAIKKEVQEQVELVSKGTPVSGNSYMQAKSAHWKGWCGSKNYVYEEVNATDKAIGFHFRYYKNEEAKKNGDYEADVRYPTQELAKVKSKDGKPLSVEFWKSFAQDADNNKQLINFSKVKREDNKAKLLLACIVTGTEYSNVEVKKINFAEAFKELSSEDREKAMKKLDLDKEGVRIEDKKFSLQDIMIMELHASRHNNGDINKVRPNSYEQIKNQVAEQVDDGKSKIKDVYMQDKNYKRIADRLAAVAEFAEKKGITELTLKEYKKVANVYEVQKNKSKEKNEKKEGTKPLQPAIQTVVAKGGTRV